MEAFSISERVFMRLVWRERSGPREAANDNCIVQRPPEIGTALMKSLVRLPPEQVASSLFRGNFSFGNR